MTTPRLTDAQRRVLARLARELSHYGRGVPTYRIHGNTIAALDRRGWITLVPRGSSESYQINDRGERTNVEVHQYYDAVITAAGRAALAGTLESSDEGRAGHAPPRPAHDPEDP